MRGGTQLSSTAGEVPADAGRVAAQELVAEYEADCGRLPSESRRRARQFMLGAGLLEDQRIGRAAGVVCKSSGTADVVDAIVVVTAVQHQASVVTSDPGDLTHLASSIGVKLQLFVV